MTTIPLLLAAVALGADPMPATVTKAPAPPPPTWAEIPADPLLTVLQSPTASRWVLIDDGADLRPAADGKSATFAAAQPGRYRLLVLPEQGEPQRARQPLHFGDGAFLDLHRGVARHESVLEDALEDHAAKVVREAGHVVCSSRRSARMGPVGAS